MEHLVKRQVKVLILTVGLLLTVTFAQAQRTASVSGNWSSTATWGGQPVPTASDAVTINSGVTVTVDQNASCASITVNSPSNANGITVSGTNSLTVGGAVTMNPSPFLTFVNSTIAVGAGSLTASSISIPGGFLNGSCIVTLSTGTINISGDITFSGLAFSAQFTFTGNGRLNIGGTLDTGGTFTASTGTVNFNGTSPQTIPDYTYYGIASNNTAGATFAADETITVLTIGDSTPNSILSDGGNQITSTGTLNLISGKFSLGSASTATTWPGFVTRNISTGTTVEYASGQTQNVSVAFAYQNLTYSGSGTKTVGDGLTILGDFNASGGPIGLSSNPTYTLAGNWNSTTTLSSNNRLQLVLNGTGNQTITNNSAFSVRSLTVNKSGGIATLGSAITINNVGITVTNGTLDLAAFSNIFAGTLNVANGAVLKLAGTQSFTGFGTLTLGATSTVEYYGAAQAVSTATYGNLILTGSGSTKTLGGNTTTAGALTINSGVIFAFHQIPSHYRVI